MIWTKFFTVELFCLVIERKILTEMRGGLNGAEVILEALDIDCKGSCQFVHDF